MISVRVPAQSAPEVARQLAGYPKAAFWFSPRRWPVMDAGSGARWAFVAADPVRTVRGGDLGRLDEAWREERTAWLNGKGPCPGIPIGVGYFRFELGWAWQGLRPDDRPGPDLPEWEFRFFDAVWQGSDTSSPSIDEQKPVAWIHAVDQGALERMQARLFAPPVPRAPMRWGPFRSVAPGEHYCSQVARVVEYLRAGDAYQVNLARKLRAPLVVEASAAVEGSPCPHDAGLTLFTALDRSAPAAHALWFPFSGAKDQSGTGGAILGNSPECFLRVSCSEGGAARFVETCPIKGTRPRAPVLVCGPAPAGSGGLDSGRDAMLLRELVESHKDRAEHVMIVDLERNDLGRICATGSVEVVDWCRPVSLPTVHHLVSRVRGRLRDDVDLQSLLRATFPGGSITGAPKRRAMQIIAELEPEQRGIYTGATGWLGAAGDVELAVAIRSAFCDGRGVDLWVGAGIVADSQPEAELAETEAKALAFMRLAETTVAPGEE